MQRNCPDSARNLILSLICKPASLLLSVNQSERRLITTNRGVFQGGGISAYVFAIYIDPLAIALNGTTACYHPSALLYADDIQLKPKSLEEAQGLLDICASFAEQLKFEWNIRKCSIVSKSPLQLTLGNRLIPNSETYKYLGAIHRYNRIDWESTVRNAIGRQARFIDTLHHSLWHPKFKLVIYRNFIRPITEYVLPLVWLWIKRNKSNRQDILKLLQTAHKNGIQFIFGRARHAPLMDYMTGFGNLDYRMECLVGGLNASFNCLKSSNPLVIASKTFCVSTSHHFIISQCFNSEYLAAYLKEKKRNLTLTWKTWWKHKLADLRQKTSGTMPLIAYYSPLKKLPDNSSLAFSLPAESFRIICDWRLNRFLNYRTCKCGSPFNRSHVSCYLQENTVFQSIMESQSFITTASLISKPNFNVLDFLLNMNRYEEFLHLFADLCSLIDL
jgi:hypothetical protein